MKQLSSLNKYFWKYRKLFFLGILFVILTNYFRILSPQITGYVINTVVHTSQKPAAADDTEKNYDIILRNVLTQFDAQPFSTKILFAGLILLVLAVISGLFMFLMRQTISVMSRHIEFDQKNEV